MQTSRRDFIRTASLAGAAMLVPGAMRALEGGIKLTILHTNDVHSRLDPFTDGSYQGKGGIAARAEMIRRIRSDEKHVLLFDSGDIFQGTPYFNLYKGEPEIKAMSMMGYDAGTIGNHDFDAGIDNLATQLKLHARFPILNCNYDFNNTAMEAHHQPYKLFTRGGLRVGVTGVGIELKGLVADGLYGSTVYHDPVERVNRTAQYLKRDKKCDLVILLSHLGDKYDDDKISDEILARRSKDVDLILGGHTHRFFEKPKVYQNDAGEEVIVNQVGWGGIQLGRLDYFFTSAGRKKIKNSGSLVVEKI